MSSYKSVDLYAKEEVDIGGESPPSITSLTLYEELGLVLNLGDVTCFLVRILLTLPPALAEKKGEGGLVT